MKETPQEKQLHENFCQGRLPVKAFGDDTRHVRDIIEDDAHTLARLGVSREQIADRLQYFIEEGKKGLETVVDVGDYTAHVVWDRGCCHRRLRRETALP